MVVIEVVYAVLQCVVAGWYVANLVVLRLVRRRLVVASATHGVCSGW
jgi:hypothetical protein